MRKIIATVTAQIILHVEDTVEMADVVSSLEFTSDSDDVNVLDTDIVDFIVVDSK